MKPPLSPDAIEQAVRRYLDLGPGSADISSPATGRFNSTYFVSGPEAEAVLRVAPPDDAGFLFYERKMMAQEPPVHALVRETADVPAPAVLGYDTARDLLPRDYLVLERLPGVPLSQAAGVNLAAVWEQVGEMLARVHAIQGQRYGYDGPHLPLAPRAAWGEAFHAMWNAMIDDIEGCKGYAPAEAERMRALLDRFMPLVDRGVPPSLLHMDVWHENVLVDRKGRVTGLLDWDRALWGDPEIEFAVLDYCGVSVPSFWRGYGGQRPDGPDASVRNVLYLLYELQKYIVIWRARRADPATADRYRGESLRLASALLERG